MKKLLRIFGFALVLGLMLAGCKKEDEWDDVTENADTIELSNGTWEEVYKYSITTDVASMDPKDLAEDPLLAGATGTYKETIKSTTKFKVEDEKITYLSGDYKSTTTYPDSVDTKTIEAYVNLYNAYYASEGTEISCKGRTVTIKQTFSAAEIEQMNAKAGTVSKEYSKVPVSGLKTNSKKTKYRYYASVEQNGTKVENEMTLAKK